MAEKDDRSQASDRKFAHLDERHLGGIENRVAKGEYVSAEELADALQKHGSRPIPAEVLDYLCRTLKGEAAKPSGRKALPDVHLRRQHMILRGVYHQNLAWLQARQAKYGHLKGWLCIREADFWNGPAHEIAARMTARRLFHGTESWRRVQNIASSRK